MDLQLVKDFMLAHKTLLQDSLEYYNLSLWGLYCRVNVINIISLRKNILQLYLVLLEHRFLMPARSNLALEMPSSVE